MGNNINKKKAKISVCMITYNHEKFIAQAIESALAQKIDSDYEIVIGEDYSTDKTREIIMKYQKENPDKIRVIYNEKNLGMMSNFINTLNACTGKYIALCEGDDYWTDQNKLQKQVDFLEANPDFAICHHNMQIIFEDGRRSYLSNLPSQKSITTINDLAKGSYIYTASCVFRNGLIKEFPIWYKDSPFGDLPLHMLNAQYGKIKYISDVMGVYRIHTGGIWGTKDSICRYEKEVEAIDLIKNYFTPKINKILCNMQNDRCNYLIMQFKDNPEKSKYYFSKLIENEPYLIESINRKMYIKRQISLIPNKLSKVIAHPIYYFKNKVIYPVVDKFKHKNNI